jgi:predicted phage-related endonuclease
MVNWKSAHPLKLSDEEYREWLRLNMEDDARRSIGSTNASAIVGKNSYRTPSDVFDSILRLVKDDVFGNSKKSQRGIILEPIILRLYEEQQARALAATALPTQHDADHDFLTAHPDGMEEDGTIIEVKTVDRDGLRAIRDNGAREKDLIQTWHYMNVCRAPAGRVLYFCADEWDLHVVDVPVNVVVQTELRERCIAFWAEHILARKRPSDLDAPAEALRVPVVGAEAVEKSDPEYVRAVARWVAATREEKLVKHEVEQAKLAVKALVERDGIDRLIVNGHKVARMQQAGKEVLDEVALLRDYPALDLDSYRVRGEASAPFVRLWPGKGA